jgi:hypothetical protein
LSIFFYSWLGELKLLPGRRRDPNPEPNTEPNPNPNTEPKPEDDPTDCRSIALGVTIAALFGLLALISKLHSIDSNF